MIPLDAFALTVVSSLVWRTVIKVVRKEDHRYGGSSEKRVLSTVNILVYMAQATRGQCRAVRSPVEMHMYQSYLALR